MILHFALKTYSRFVQKKGSNSTHFFNLVFCILISLNHFGISCATVTRWNLQKLVTFITTEKTLRKNAYHFHVYECKF